MKKIQYFLLSIFLLLFSLQSTYAKESMDSQENASEETATSAAQITPTPIPDYSLPYPGILPDSPLYSLKAFRDKIISILISDPLKKAEFDLLQADKRLNSGIYLFEKKKVSLAESTISKGENYFEEAIERAKEAAQQGHKTANLVRRLSQAAKKHQQVIRDLEKKATKEQANSFKALQERISNIIKNVDKLTST